MGSKGDCYDNAVAETFFATIKKELVRRQAWPTRQQLASEVFEYIEGFSNPRRRHSTLGYSSRGPVRGAARRLRAYARAKHLKNVNGVLKTLRVSDTNNDDYDDNNDCARDESPELSGEAGEVRQDEVAAPLTSASPVRLVASEPVACRSAA